MLWSIKGIDYCNSDLHQLRNSDSTFIMQLIEQYCYALQKQTLDSVHE